MGKQRASVRRLREQRRIKHLTRLLANSQSTGFSSGWVPQLLWDPTIVPKCPLNNLYKSVPWESEGF